MDWFARHATWRGWRIAIIGTAAIVDMKLDRSDFIATGSDADWGGPYSGGRFRVDPKDLPRILDVPARFTDASIATGGSFKF